VACLSSGWADGGYVDCCRVAGRPAGQWVDRVDLDEAVAFPEGPGGLVGAVAGRAVQGLGLYDADPGGCQVVQDVAEQPGSVPAAAPGGVDGDPQDLRPAGDFLAATAKPATVPESVMTQAWWLAASRSAFAGTSSVK
jgi:hypothetical protein